MRRINKDDNCKGDQDGVEDEDGEKSEDYEPEDDDEYEPEHDDEDEDKKEEEDKNERDDRVGEKKTKVRTCKDCKKPLAKMGHTHFRGD